MELDFIVMWIMKWMINNGLWYFLFLFFSKEFFFRCSLWVGERWPWKRCRWSSHTTTSSRRRRKTNRYVFYIYFDIILAQLFCFVFILRALLCAVVWFVFHIFELLIFFLLLFFFFCFLFLFLDKVFMEHQMILSLKQQKRRLWIQRRKTKAGLYLTYVQQHQ